MGYYILYPKSKTAKVKVTKKRPNPKTESRKYGFAEGPFSTKKAVKIRLNWMNYSCVKRPKGYC